MLIQSSVIFQPLSAPLFPPAFSPPQIADSNGETRFLGYETLTGEGKLLAFLSGGQEAAGELSADQEVTVVLDRTPFYAESGGQVGDRGTLVLEAPGKRRVEVAVRDVQKAGGGRVFVHTGTVVGAPEGAPAAAAEVSVSAAVDPVFRRQARCNHTSTHLLQSALRTVLGSEISQAGSLVDFDRLRFDFNCPTPPTPQQVAEVEQIVNGTRQINFSAGFTA